MLIINRDKNNPLLKPDTNYSWQAKATFNGCPVQVGHQTHMLFRAFSRPQYNVVAGSRMSISTIGHAVSNDGTNYKDKKIFIAPQHDWDKFGCEDPRVTKIGDTYYIFYTALSKYPFTADGIKVAVATTKDFKTIKERHLVTPFNAKAMTLFPGKINGKLVAILSVNTDNPPVKMAIIYFDKPSQIWSEAYWNKWYKNIDKHTINLRRTDDDHVEVGAPPIATKDGWLLIYSHIRHYPSPQQRLFGIEAVLLDKKDPTRIKTRTDSPLMVPDDIYEKYGMVPNIIFPSGALVRNNNLDIYYGGADTVVCRATTDLPRLLRHIKIPEDKKIRFKRCSAKPIITPKPENAWEAMSTFNPAAFYAGGKIHILYRAMGFDNTSVIGYANTRDGIKIDERLDQPIYVPRTDFEAKHSPGNTGCEDPRVTVIGNTLYMLYTAFNGIEAPKVALTSIPVAKFLKKQWDWKMPVLISAPGFDDKDACVFPEKINGKYLIYHRIGDDIDIAMVPSLNFDGKTYLEERRWLKQRSGHWDNRKVGVAAPPFRTKKGWVLLYHGVSKKDGIYRVGAALLDKKDPTRILARSDSPLFEPRELYEKEGDVPNVVFPCGNVVIGNKVLIYYGGGDKVVNVASLKIDDLLKVF